MAQPEVLTTRHLNRALLARQSLLARSEGGLRETLERIGGLQSQYAPSAYLGLWSRHEGLRRADLTDALVDRRVVQATLMRSTIHVVSSQDLAPMAAAVAAARRNQWLRAARARGLHEVPYAEIAELVRRELAGGPRRRAELVAVITAAGHPREAWEGVGLWVDLVRAPPSGTWERRRADLYALADQWVPMTPVTEQEGLEHLVRRYLGGFGPAAPADVASWAGVPLSVLRPAIAAVANRAFVAEDGAGLVDLEGAEIPEPGAHAPVRFLPTWDATLLVHARRTGVLPEEHRSRIFHVRNPHSTPTFLVDGTVAGTWRLDRESVRIEPFAPLPRRVLDDLEQEAARLAAFAAS